jgi:hypothetical protein
MLERKATAPESEALRRERRSFLRLLAAGALAQGVVGWWPSGGAARAAKSAAPALPPATRSLLEKSPYVYVSPLRVDGGESSCHGEVWYGWLDESVVLITATTAWKARALSSGRDRARLWVGDHGPWKKALGTNEEFRSAPHFEARAERVEDAQVLERLMQDYRRKYPAGIGKWEPRMRSGFADGTRVLIRYSPI